MQPSQDWEKCFRSLPRTQRMNDEVTAIEMGWTGVISLIGWGFGIFFGWPAHNWMITLGLGFLSMGAGCVVGVFIAEGYKGSTKAEKRLREAIEARNKLSALPVQSEQSRQALELAEATVQALAQVAALNRADEIANDQTAILERLKLQALPEAKAQIEVIDISPS